MTMAKTLQVREVPEHVHAALRARATIAGMSLSDYALATLTEVSERPLVAETLRVAGERAGGASRDEILKAMSELRGR